MQLYEHRLKIRTGKLVTWRSWYIMKMNMSDLPEGCGGNVSHRWVEAFPQLEKPRMSRTPAVTNKRHMNDMHGYILKATERENAGIRDRVNINNEG